MWILIILGIIVIVGIIVSSILTYFNARYWDDELIYILPWLLTGILAIALLIVGIIAGTTNCRLDYKLEQYNLETEQYQYIIDNKVYEDDILSTEYKEFINKIIDRNLKLKGDKHEKNSLWVGIFIPKNIDEYKEVVLR